jgi:hypothetical protein
MSTLNSGFKHPTNSIKHITSSERRLIDKFIGEKGVFKCPHISAEGNEQAQSTHAYVLEKRKEFRQIQRAKAKLRESLDQC